MPRGGDDDSHAGGDLGPLPGGHHGLSPEQVAESQRERLLAATVELIAERGYAAAPITEIVKRASVANRVFYTNFKSKEEAFVAAFDAVADHLESLVRGAVAPAPDWPAQAIAALRAVLEFFEGEPEIARFCFIAPFTAPVPVASHCRERVAAGLPYLARGRTVQPGEEELPESTEDSLVGGVVSQLGRWALTQPGPLADLLPALAEFVLAPYLGTAEARRLAEAAAATTG